MKDKYLQLIHQELDGVNSPEESAELQAYLSAHPEARRSYEELAALSEKLKHVTMTEVPPGLTNRIMGAIASSAERRPGTSTVLTRVSALLEDLRALKWRYALSFSVGLAMGLVLLFFVMRKTDDTSYLHGVMGLKGDFSEFVATDNADIALAKITGHVRVKSSSDVLRVELLFHSSIEMELRIEYDSSALSFYGFRRLDGPDSCRIRLQSGEISMTHTGNRHYLLVLQGRTDVASPLRLKILDGQTPLYERVLQASGKR